MKYIILAILTLNLGCGMVESMNDKCGGTHEDLCHALLGGKEDEKQDERMDDQQTQIDLLLQNLELMNINLGSQILALESLVLNGVSNLQAQINALQLTIATNQTQIATLQGYENITSIIDPCTDGPGVDEVLLRTSSGRIIASFSQNASGLNTRFAVIAPGTYGTTDGTGCTFTVNVNGSVTPSVEL